MISDGLRECILELNSKKTYKLQKIIKNDNTERNVLSFLPFLDTDKIATKYQKIKNYLLIILLISTRRFDLSFV